MSERTMADWANWYYEQPIVQRVKGRLRVTSEQMAYLKAYCDENNIPWPANGMPLLFGCELYEQENTHG